MKKRERNAEKRTGLVAFFRTLPKYKLPWFWIAAAFAFNVVFNQVLLKLPTTTADLLSGSLEGTALWKALRYYLIYAVLASVQSGILRTTEVFSVYRSRKSLWRKMLHTRVSYYDENNPAQMMSAVTNDISGAMGLMVNMIIYMLPDMFYIGQALMKISEYHISLMLAELAILPMKYIYMVVMGRYVSRVTMGMYDKIGMMTGYLAERIHHLAHIKTFNCETKEREHGRETAGKLYKANMDIARWDAVNNAISTALSVIEKLIVMMAAVILLQRGIITIQQWVAFFLFSGYISTKFDSFIVVWMSLKQVQGSAARSVEMMNAEEEMSDGNTKVQRTEQMKDTTIVFDKVSFAYGEHEVLKQVSFEIPAGTSACIVGLCGSGKTTALNLLERFYDLKEGDIRLGGISVKDMPLKDYRRNFSYVQQGAAVFAGTVRDALTYGIPEEISDEAVMEAAECTGFDQYLREQPEGLDICLASGGGSMSGGQKQRLVLTRELLRHADIILMDEPTSALDTETSGKIRQMIQTIFKGKTKLIVSHDLDLARDMDRIVVLEKGICVGSGTFEELMNSCSLFREMVAACHQEKEAAE